MYIMLKPLNQKTIDEIMTQYTVNLKEKLSDNLLAVMLYGSCARGDHVIGSDVDVFILVKEIDCNVKDLKDVYEGVF